MTLLRPAALALTTATLAMGAAPVHAQSGGYYAVTLATPLTAPKDVILGDTLWHCAGTSCSAGQDPSRPAIVCARLSRAVGAISRFATPAGDLPADDLAKCNGNRK
ncbi:hypothetical protein Y88_1907 [Novosphingobium nitrogenifigens DSM 19370]|uniref:Secreted protein n=1 Tax=Novosphingobium nitrogenifigens DSM 19370 TaxID=983920 RepID=F1Z568_9SPHN|nr:hypothetical protein [Novosphingobium nitrogenifigens]EGD60033.1 hypothetical protein Y88_1907 [Novosphingobium nitrogenifigens DSM 19370]